MKMWTEELGMVGGRMGMNGRRKDAGWWKEGKEEIKALEGINSARFCVERKELFGSSTLETYS